MEELKSNVRDVQTIAVKSAAQRRHHLRKCLSRRSGQLLLLEVQQVCKDKDIVAEHVVPGKYWFIVLAFCALDASRYEVLVVVGQQPGCLLRLQVKRLA